MRRVFTSCLVSSHLLLGQGQHLQAFPTALTDRTRAGPVILVPLILAYLNRSSLDIKSKKNFLKDWKIGAILLILSDLDLNVFLYIFLILKIPGWGGKYFSRTFIWERDSPTLK